VEGFVACGGRTLGLVVGGMVGCDIWFVVKLRLLVGTGDEAFVAMVGMVDGAA